MAILTLLLVAFFCLFFSSTRMIGVIGITLLLLAFPLALLLILAVLGLFYFCKSKLSRRFKNYVQPKLPT